MKPYMNRAAAFLTAAAISIPAIGVSAESAQDVAAEIAGNQKKFYETSSNDGVKASAGKEQEAMAGVPNPMVEYPAYGVAAKALGFPPLALPEMTGYQCSKIFVIGGNVGEIRYGRKWEPEVNLTVRTYKLAKGEAVHDITGIYGVEWRTETAKGMKLYIAKVGDNSYAATWSVEPYIFAAYAENIAYTPFMNVVTNGLMEISSAFYRNYAVSTTTTDEIAVSKTASSEEQTVTVKETPADSDKRM